MRLLRTAVFASGQGTNFAVLEAHARRSEQAGWTPVLLLTDREGTGAARIAEERGVRSAVVPPGEDPERFADELLALLEAEEVELVLLAGYLRLMPAAVVRRFRGRMLNLHPALLPAFGGKGMYGARVHEAVLASGARVSGATVHFVDEVYDRGRIFAQWPVPVLPDDTPASLQARIHEVEHALYPAAVDALARALIREEPPVAPPLQGHHFQLHPHPPDLP